MSDRKIFWIHGNNIGITRKKKMRLCDHYVVCFGNDRVIHYARAVEDFASEIKVQATSIQDFFMDDNFIFLQGLSVIK